MARISFTPLVAELVGKLAGSVFQYSYGGFQVHSRVTPSNPQTNRQQLRRGWFGWLAGNWRNLTPTEQGTFITAAGSAPEGLRLFIGSNINLYLINEPTITAYVPSAVPASMAMDIDSLGVGVMDIIAAGSPSTVPAGQVLLIFATAAKVLPKVFTNPSEFSPIVYFDEGTDMSSSTSIITEWEALYGIYNGTDRICINSVLIEKSNGSRSVDSIMCLPPVPSTTERIMDSDGTFITDYDGVYVVQQ